jgi:hypothetical protein
MADPQDTDAIEEQALVAGHAEVRGQPDPELAPAPAAEPADFPGAPAADEARELGAQPGGAAEAPSPTMSPEEVAEWRAMKAAFPSVKQGLDSIAGRLGGMNRVIQELQHARQTQPQGSPAVARAERIAADQLKKLSADYPELASALADDLTEILSAPQSQAATQKIDVEAINRNAEHAAVSRVEKRMLDRAHPNWEADIALKDELGRPLRDQSGRYIPSQTFVEWLQSKPENFRQAFIGAVDSDFLSSGLTDFKEFRAQRLGQGSALPTRQSSPAPSAAPTPAASKQARLAAAITPQGRTSSVGSAALSEDDAFTAGFQSVRGRT